MEDKKFVCTLLTITKEEITSSRRFRETNGEDSSMRILLSAKDRGTHHMETQDS